MKCSEQTSLHRGSAPTAPDMTSEHVAAIKHRWVEPKDEMLVCLQNELSPGERREVLAPRTRRIRVGEGHDDDVDLSRVDFEPNRLFGESGGRRLVDRDMRIRRQQRPWQQADQSNLDTCQDRDSRGSSALPSSGYGTASPDSADTGHTASSQS